MTSSTPPAERGSRSRRGRGRQDAGADRAAAETPGIVSILRAIIAKLSPRRRRQLVLLSLLLIAGAVAEVVTIGAVVPFVTLLAAPERAASLPIVSELMRWADWENPRSLLLPATIFFSAAAIGAGIVRALLIWATSKFTFKVGHDFAVEIFARVLSQPYVYHSRYNSSNILGSLNKIQMASISMILPALRGVSAVVISLFIIAALVIVSPTVSAIAFLVFGLSYLMVSLLVRRTIRRNSKVIASVQGERVKIVQEGIGGIRDILIDNTQGDFVRRFSRVEHAMRSAMAFNQFASIVPRYVIEAVAVVLMAVLAFVLTRQAGGIVELLPTFGALAIGAQRLLPTVQQAYQGWAQVTANAAVAVDILRLLDLPKRSLPAGEGGVEPLRFSREIRLENVCFRYSADEALVLQGVDLVIPRGSRIGLMGRTGSGKTTMADILMGLLEPTAGALKVDGLTITEAERRAWQKNIAHVPQHIFLLDASIAENIAFGVAADRIDHALLRDAAARAELAPLIDSLPDGYATVVGERGFRLSGGQRQRIGIARALYKRASLLIFDEATSALDSDTESAVMKAVGALSRDLTIVIVAHRLSTLAHCDLVIELLDGRIARTGTYRELVGESVRSRAPRAPRKAAGAT